MSLTYWWQCHWPTDDTVSLTYWWLCHWPTDDSVTDILVTVSLTYWWHSVTDILVTVSLTYWWHSVTDTVRVTWHMDGLQVSVSVTVSEWRHTWMGYKCLWVSLSGWHQPWVTSNHRHVNVWIKSHISEIRTQQSVACVINPNSHYLPLKMFDFHLINVNWNLVYVSHQRKIK